MKTTRCKKTIRDLANQIAAQAGKESDYYPVDRYFLNKYLDQILAEDRLSFLFCNLERVNNTYTVQLLVCLPELWEDLEVRDIRVLIRSFTNVFSFYALIEFTHKYLEIDILDFIFNDSIIHDNIKKDVSEFLESQFVNLVKDEDDVNELEQQLLGVKYDDLLYIKQKLLASGEVKEAYKTARELRLGMIKSGYWRSSQCWQCSKQHMGANVVL